MTSKIFELREASTATPKCDCGECIIEVVESGGGSMQRIKSGHRTALKFVNPKAKVVEGDCNTAYLKAKSGFKWVPK